jgi:hypothetical protein
VSVKHIHTYLVHPRKGATSGPPIGGTSVALDGKLFRLLDNIYSTSGTELDIDISFNKGKDGTQTNACRDLITKYVGQPTLLNGKRIAERLAGLTDQRSGLGLLFLISGKEGSDHKIVVSRFPTDTAILVEEGAAALTVQFLERVFMKSQTSYKAVAYQDSSLRAGFWTGRAIDRQINSRVSELSNYWIFDFLDSDFLVTPAAGTRRLAVALQNATKKAGDLQVSNEIVSAVTLAGALQGKPTSIRDFEKHFGLSNSAIQLIETELKTPGLAEERFQFDHDEFKSHVAYRSLELNNGAMLTAPSSDFDKVFRREPIDGKSGRVRVSTEGTVVDERLKKVR